MFLVLVHFANQWYNVFKYSRSQIHFPLRHFTLKAFMNPFITPKSTLQIHLKEKWKFFLDFNLKLLWSKIKYLVKILIWTFSQNLGAWANAWTLEFLVFFLRLALYTKFHQNQESRLVRSSIFFLIVLSS